MPRTVLCVGSRPFERDELGFDSSYLLVPVVSYSAAEAYLSDDTRRSTLDILLTRYCLDTISAKSFIDRTSSGLAVISRARGLGYNGPILLAEHHINVGLHRKVQELGGTGCIENPLDSRYVGIWDELISQGHSRLLDTYFSQAECFVDYEALMISRLQAEQDAQHDLLRQRVQAAVDKSRSLQRSSC